MFELSAFQAFCFWMVMCWLVYQCRVAPLQPDQLQDDLADVDVDDVHRRREMIAWENRDRFQVNLKLSGRWHR